uniref:Uncharacterized protein n=1 Tax=Tetradesmus obliquus TaxID=3088 RepID=A0A383VUH8_TETOB|eukprot:jgi/Sobl393_1/7700/SZX68523.1
MTEQQSTAASAAPWAVPLLAGTLLTAVYAVPAWASIELLSTASSQAPAALQQERIMQQLPGAPQLTSEPQQQLSCKQQQVQELFQVGEGRTHWLLQVLGIGVVNILGLWAVLKVLQISKDTSTPVTVLRLHAGLRVEGQQLQERLHFLQGMLPVEHGMFFSLEEAIQLLCNPPRGTQLAYADLAVKPLSSKLDGYDLFKKYAAAEQETAIAEEASHVQHGSRPAAPQHRNTLQRLMGAAETQDVEESTSCVVVTLVMLAQGTVSMPNDVIRDVQTFKNAMKQLCGGLRSGQLLAVELLMTPDDPADFLSEAQLQEDYPFFTDLQTGKRLDALRQQAPQQGGAGSSAAAPAGA